MQGHWLACLPRTRAEDPVPSARGTDTAVGLARCHGMHVLSPNKEVCIESETGKDVVLRASKPGTAVKTLSLGEKVLQAVVRSYVAERGQEGACTGLPRPAGPLPQPAPHVQEALWLERGPPCEI